MSILYPFINFFKVVKLILKGNKWYYAWIAFLSFFILIGIFSYIKQLNYGMILTAMRDQVSWGFYISNFTFLVGVAAAAVYLVVPAYVYNFKPIKEIVLFGELLAATAIIMSILFILVDLGRPDRVWHLLPVVGKMHFPASLLAWDVLVLNGYLVLNLFIPFYGLYMIAHNKEYNLQLIKPLIIISIPWAISIHTVTAFLYNGLSSRPYWNAAVLAPRFIASALCSGPALMLIIFQIVRKIYPKIDIDNRAIFKIAEMVAYAMGVNLFLFAAEFFKEFYSQSIHLAPMKYLYFGLNGHTNLVPWSWMALIFNVTAFILFLLPSTRKQFFSLNLACVLVIAGVYIEKGMGLVIPGFVPGTLGEIYEYTPVHLEKFITIGIWAAGALIYTMFLKFMVPIYTGEVRFLSKEKKTA